MPGSKGYRAHIDPAVVALKALAVENPYLHEARLRLKRGVGTRKDCEGWTIAIINMRMSNEIADKTMETMLSVVRTEYLQGKPWDLEPVTKWWEHTESDPHKLTRP